MVEILDGQTLPSVQEQESSNVESNEHSDLKLNVEYIDRPHSLVESPDRPLPVHIKISRFQDEPPTTTVNFLKKNKHTWGLLKKKESSKPAGKETKLFQWYKKRKAQQELKRIEKQEKQWEENIRTEQLRREKEEEYLKQLRARQREIPKPPERPLIIEPKPQKESLNFLCLKKKKTAESVTSKPLIKSQHSFAKSRKVRRKESLNDRFEDYSNGPMLNVGFVDRAHDVVETDPSTLLPINVTSYRVRYPTAIHVYYVKTERDEEVCKRPKPFCNWFKKRKALREFRQMEKRHRDLQACIRQEKERKELEDSYLKHLKERQKVLDKQLAECIDPENCLLGGQKKKKKGREKVEKIKPEKIKPEKKVREKKVKEKKVKEKKVREKKVKVKKKKEKKYKATTVKPHAATRATSAVIKVRHKEPFSERLAIFCYRCCCQFFCCVTFLLVFAIVLIYVL